MIIFRIQPRIARTPKNTKKRCIKENIESSEIDISAIEITEPEAEVPDPEIVEEVVLYPSQPVSSKAVHIS